MNNNLNINTSIGKTSAKRQINHFVAIRAQGISKLAMCCDTSGNFFLEQKKIKNNIIKMETILCKNLNDIQNYNFIIE